MYPYARVSDCLGEVPALMYGHEKAHHVESILAQCLLDASRLFDSEIFAPMDYFTPAAAVATERTFYGNGTTYIRLFPFVDDFDDVVVKDADDNVLEIESYRLSKSDSYQPSGFYLKWLYRNCAYRWYGFPKVKVTARWGFQCVPADVAVAVKNMGCLMFLINPQNRLGQSENALTEEQETRLRNTYNRILSVWQDKFRHNQLGI